MPTFYAYTGDKSESAMKYISKAKFEDVFNDIKQEHISIMLGKIHEKQKAYKDSLSNINQLQ